MFKVSMGGQDFGEFQGLLKGSATLAKWVDGQGVVYILMR